MANGPLPTRKPFIRGQGVNETERRLKSLCDRAFLTPWSYPGVHKEPGKELCDSLAVSGNDVVIFSVKTATFAEGDLDRAWTKWFSKAVLESLRQLRGAERWIKNHPNRLFVDSACTEPFPLPIPDPDVARYHRILIAHGAAERCRRETGGSGSPRIVPAIIGPMHFVSKAEGGEPFAIGTLDEELGYVHVFDEASTDNLLSELDTAFDLLSYLTWKENLVQRGRLERAESELDLLAFYLERVHATNENQPELPDEIDDLERIAY